MCKCMHVCECVCMYVHVCACVYVYICVCVCVCVCMYISMRVCMCVCVCMYVCARVCALQQPAAGLFVFSFPLTCLDILCLSFVSCRHRFLTHCGVAHAQCVSERSDYDVKNSLPGLFVLSIIILTERACAAWHN